MFALILIAALPQGAPPEFSGPRAGVELKQLDGVDVVEKLEAQVPADLVFRDPTGAPVRFGELFDGKRPVVLSFNYENCPQLCAVQLGGFVDGLNLETEWTVGEQFRIVTVGLDPTEDDAHAALFRERVLGQYRAGDTAAASAGWSFLRGDERSVRALADAVGYSYKYDEEREEYAHYAAMVLISPQGKVARYLYGINFEPQVLRLSLAETAAGEFVSTMDRILLSCYVFDPNSNSYTLRAWTVIRIVLSGLALSTIAFLWWLHRHVKPQNHIRAAA
ncbi:MAG: SCO family protein [Planctomycetota bacterium]|nr:SCO family protein [Planctomycetota bacterium]